MDPLDTPILIRRARPAEVIDLRHLVLRAGLPRETAIFPGDDSPGARHYGAFRGEELLCCATLHPGEWEGRPAYQLRGMATAAHARGRGIGRRVLEWIERDLLAGDDAVQLWCNARVPAVEFYRTMGWQVASDVFDIPTAGPHVKMTRRLARGGWAAGHTVPAGRRSTFWAPSR